METEQLGGIPRLQGDWKPTKVEPADKDTKPTAHEDMAGTQGPHDFREKTATYTDPLASLGNHMLLGLWNKFTGIHKKFQKLFPSLQV